MTAIIHDSADLFFIKKEDLLNLERFAEKSAENTINSIKSKRYVPLSKFIYSLGIEHVGEETAFVLAKEFKTLNNLKNIRLDNLQKIPDVGPVVAKSIYEWFQRPFNLRLLEKFRKGGVRVIEEKTSKESSRLAGKTFVLTGTLESMGRDQAKDRVRELGGDIPSTVSKNTDYVVVGSEPGSKYEKAKKLGVRVINEREFVKLIE